MAANNINNTKQQNTSFNKILLDDLIEYLEQNIYKEDDDESVNFDEVIDVNMNQNLNENREDNKKFVLFKDSNSVLNLTDGFYRIQAKIINCEYEKSIEKLLILNEGMK